MCSLSSYSAPSSHPQRQISDHQRQNSNHYKLHDKQAPNGERETQSAPPGDGRSEEKFWEDNPGDRNRHNQENAWQVSLWNREP